MLRLWQNLDIHKLNFLFPTFHWPSIVFPRARRMLLVAHSRLPKPAVPAVIEVRTTWQWMMEESK